MTISMMMKKLFFISLVVVLFVSHGLFASEEKIVQASAPKKITSIKTSANHWSLGIDGGLIFVGSTQVVGVNGSYFLTDSLALEAIISRVLDFSTNYGAGVRYHLLSHSPFSPYGFLRGGYLDIDPVTIKVFDKEYSIFKSGVFAASAGPGIQYLFNNGVAIQLEGGLTTIEFRGVLGQLNLGAAYFF